MKEIERYAFEAYKHMFIAQEMLEETKKYCEAPIDLPGYLSFIRHRIEELEQVKILIGDVIKSARSGGDGKIFKGSGHQTDDLEKEIKNGR